jgi:hypothetical protein
MGSLGTKITVDPSTIDPEDFFTLKDWKHRAWNIFKLSEFHSTYKDISEDAFRYALTFAYRQLSRGGLACLMSLFGYSMTEIQATVFPTTSYGRLCDLRRSFIRAVTYKYSWAIKGGAIPVDGMSIQIRDLPISCKVTTPIYRKYGIRAKVSDFKDVTYEELCNTRNLGPIGVNKFCEELEKHGLHISGYNEKTPETDKIIEEFGSLVRDMNSIHRKFIQSGLPANADTTMLHLYIKQIQDLIENITY